LIIADQCVSCLKFFSLQIYKIYTDDDDTDE